MQKLYSPFRMAIVFIAVTVLLAVFIAALYKLQIYDTRPVEEDLYPRRENKRVLTLAAARGNIYDRNGVLLAGNRPKYSISLIRMPRLSHSEMNEIIRKLVYAATEYDVRYNDTFPITRGAPFSYYVDMSNQQRNRLDKYIESFNSLEPDVSASDLFVWLKSRYGLDYTTNLSDTRLIIGLRYELETRALGITSGVYVFAEDVSAEFAAVVEEMGLLGVTVETSSQRRYYTRYASHLIGYTQSMDKNDIEKYAEYDYPMDAKVGKMGAEMAFELYLHGSDGAQEVITSDTGTVLGVNVIREPDPGDNVYLSIDIGLQTVTEDALSSHIETINSEREEGSQVTGGAVVITEVNSGEVLAMASNPTFELNTLMENFAAISQDESSLMVNRATHGRYNPGSTFKMVTAFAALREGYIGRWTQINDTGRYTALDFQPTCWIYGMTGYGHGPLDVVGALEHSCNYYFYQIGDSITFRPIANTALEFGLGQKTGIEVSEFSGIAATREYKREALDEGWWDADNLLTAIGQSHNYFPPIQLANYTATIANNGNRYPLTILNRVKSADYSELVYTHVPEVIHNIGYPEYINILQEGMRAVARTGTAASAFADYPIPVAAKTGTVQSDLSQVNDGVFVCYAPANNPEIAIAIVVEKGTSGSSLMEIAKTVLDYYFASESRPAPAIPEGSLIP